MDTNIEYNLPAMEKGESRKKEERKYWTDRIKNPVLREIAEWVEMLLIAAVIAWFVNSFIIANSQVPTGSMEETIMAGDRVFGLRLRYTFGDPEKGDIAIFKFGWRCRHCNAQGENPAPDICPSCGRSLKHPATVYYVKRIIGGPGDEVEIVADGSCEQSEIISEARFSFSEENAGKRLVTAAVYVNGEKLEEPYLREPMLYTGDMKFSVPEGCYFMMGDNRNGSLDARFWRNKFIPKERMIAKVYVRYFPKPSVIR